ncbi:class I SAM-dependent methyltransferase [Myxococcota bacterium]|nr:class I SAM-dependent methyltransferase [Myxococcota bacterium]
MNAPDLTRHFERGSIAKLLARGHPYDFVETYETVRALYGYSAFYVNLGLWTDGAATVEPGRALALRVAEPLGLAPGEHLVDAGSGLGQAAIDLARHHALASVWGVNVSARQVGFANDLARSTGLADRVEHVVADACSALATRPAHGADGVLAIECIGHFADPMGFLRGARHVLRPGRRLAFCLNVARAPLAGLDRRLISATFGFVPETLATWRARLVDAGFTSIETVDLTRDVTGALGPILTERLTCPTEQVRALPWSTRFVVKTMQRFTTRAVDGGRVGYALVSAVSP